MGQCVTKCKNPSSTLGSKNGDRDPSSKSYSRRGAGHREEQLPACGKPGGDILVNGTKKAEAAAEACQLPTSSGDAGREPKSNAEESSLQRLEELFRRYKDERMQFWRKAWSAFAMTYVWTPRNFECCSWLGSSRLLPCANSPG